MSLLTVTVLSVTLSPSWSGYVGMYADPLHCRAMQDIIAEDDPGAVVRCENVVLLEPVPVPPPRPDNLNFKSFTVYDTLIIAMEGVCAALLDTPIDEVGTDETT